MSIIKQQLGKYAPPAANMYTTIEALLGAACSIRPTLKLHREDQQDHNSQVDSCTIPTVMRQKNMVMSTAGPGTKNDCAGEDQQQFT